VVSVVVSVVIVVVILLLCRAWLGWFPTDSGVINHYRLKPVVWLAAESRRCSG